MTKVIDASRIAEVIILYQIYVTIDVTFQGSIGIVVVFSVVGVAIVEVRGTRVGQLLLGIVLNSLQLIAIVGDDKTVNQSILSLIVHAIAFNAGYVVPFGHVREKAVLVVGFALGVTFFAMLVNIIYFGVAKESKSSSKKSSQDVGI